MKKSILLLAVLLLLLTGCGKETAEPSSAAAEPPAASSEAAEELSIDGTVLDGTLNSLTILTDDERILTFSTRTADKSGCTGLLIDSRVTVFYTGEIEGEETRRCTVTRLVQEP